jgi:hypothetical protein
MGSSRPVPVSTKANQNRENKTVRASYAIARRRVIAIGTHCGRARQSIPQERVHRTNGSTASAAPHRWGSPAGAGRRIGWGGVGSATLRTRTSRGRLRPSAPPAHRTAYPPLLRLCGACCAACHGSNGTRAIRHIEQLSRCTEHAVGLRRCIWFAVLHGSHFTGMRKNSLP